MRLLFEMDKKDYGECTRSFTRDSARSIIIRNCKIAMIHSLKYDYYKFPGGGIEPGESDIDALIRETAEEAGLTVVPDTIPSLVSGILLTACRIPWPEAGIRKRQPENPHEQHPTGKEVFL